MNNSGQRLQGLGHQQVEQPGLNSTEFTTTGMPMGTPIAAMENDPSREPTSLSAPTTTSATLDPATDAQEILGMINPH